MTHYIPRLQRVWIVLTIVLQLRVLLRRPIEISHLILCDTLNNWLKAVIETSKLHNDHFLSVVAADCDIGDTAQNTNSIQSINTLIQIKAYIHTVILTSSSSQVSSLRTVLRTVPKSFSSPCRRIQSWELSTAGSKCPLECRSYNSERTQLTIGKQEWFLHV